MRVIESDILKRASLSISNKINFIIVGQWDIRVCNLDDAFRLFVYCLQRAIAEMETQINGVVLIMDFKDFTLHQAKHVTLAFLKKFASLIQVLSNNCNLFSRLAFLRSSQDVFPIRCMGINVVHEPCVLKILVSMIWPFLSQKIRDRVCHFIIVYY